MDSENGVPEFNYDAVDGMTSRTDPVDNTTLWTFDLLGPVVTGTITVSSNQLADIVHERATTEFADYDFAWDAGGRLTDFGFACESRPGSPSFLNLGLLSEPLVPIVASRPHAQMSR